ncbi:glycosyl transferase [Sagittula stellata]|uniref:glycosyl transferase n=1 Tax=Sagittula stellata TaxID=52603 RepID=UPI00321995DD
MSQSALSPVPALPRITVLMACHQGAAHLGQQLASIAAQEGVDWHLRASDDGPGQAADDGTAALLARFRDAHPHRVTLHEGPRRGASVHFLSLLCAPDLGPGPVALSDQDDIWYPAKLRQALSRLNSIPGPAAYTARSRHVDTHGHPLGLSRRPRGAPSFGNALVQNRVSGHAAVLNPQALALVRAVGPVDVPFHDWWLALLITGAGGTVVEDDAVVLDYRQHGENVLGAPRGWRARLTRAVRVLGPEGRRIMAANRTALARAAPFLTGDARALLARLDTAPAHGPARLRALSRLGVRRDAPAAQAVLALAATFGRY